MSLRRKKHAILGLAFAVLEMLATTSFAAVDPPADTVKPQFNIAEYRVLGNTVLEVREIERVVYPKLGPGKTIDDVETARAALEARYHELGFATVFVDTPEQDVSDGIVRLRVTEGRIAHTRISGARYFSNGAIRSGMPAATPDTVPHLPSLQAQLAELNSQTPDRTVTPVLTAGKNPGTVDLALKVRDELPFHASVELNDQYTADTSRLRAIIAASYDNLFGRMDSLSLQYQTAPRNRNEVDVWAASYTRRLWDVGARVAFFFVDSNSDVATVGDAGATLTVLGKGKIYGVRYIQPLVNSAAASHTLLGGLEYKNFTESIISKDLLSTPITYGNFSIGHAGAWRGEKNQFSMTNSLNFGIRSLFNDPQEFAVKRRLGKPNYMLWRADAAYLRPLASRLVLRLRASGQYARDSIISNEQFSIGGAGGVRGYLEAEELGDSGIKTSIEVGSTQLSWISDRLQADAFLFFDYGRMTRVNPLRAQDRVTLVEGDLLERPNDTLRSAGIGLNFDVFNHFSGSLGWAYPLADSSNANGTRSGDSRLIFTVKSSW